MTTIPATRAKKLVTEFAGRRHRYEPGARSIDIIARGVEYADATVFETSDEGATVRNFFGPVLVPWGDIRAVRLRTLGEDGRWSDGMRFDVAAAPAERRAA